MRDKRFIIVHGAKDPNQGSYEVANPRRKREIKVVTKSPQSPPSKLLSIASMVLFIGLFSLISIGGIAAQSPTVDEPVHLLSGYAALKWSDYRANPEHPPLAKLWAALPLLAMDIKDPRPAAIAWEIIPLTPPHTTHTGSVAAKLFFVDNDGETLFFWAKLQFLLLALLLGGFIYRWSKELFGFEAAIASLFLYGLDPNIIAHSQIVHTDIAFTGLFFIGSYFFWLHWRNSHGRVSRLRRASSVWRQPRNTPILPCWQSGAHWPLSVRSLLGPWNAPWASLASWLAGGRKPCSCAASFFAHSSLLIA